MKVIFHIGTPKTGSSRIQKVFRDNQKALLEKGILYPMSHGATSNNIRLAIPILGIMPRSGKGVGEGDYDKALADSQEAWAQVSKETAQVKPKMLILSSETLFGGRQINKIPILIEKYFGNGVDTEFLVYLRTPSQHYASMMQQKLKASHIIPTIKSQNLIPWTSSQRWGMSSRGSLIEINSLVEMLRGMLFRR